jgi:hypothetical protein
MARERGIEIVGEYDAAKCYLRGEALERWQVERAALMAGPAEP